MKIIVALGKVLFVHSVTACCQRMGEKLGRGHYHIRQKQDHKGLTFVIDDQEISFCPFCGQNINIIAKKKHELERSAGR